MVLPQCYPTQFEVLGPVANREKCWGFGGEGQNRTVDTTIFSRMLYQLSYLATRWVAQLATW